MRNPLPFILWLGATVAGWFAVSPSLDNPMGFVWLAGISFAAGVVASSIRVAAQWEKALLFRLGRFKASKGPGLYFAMPFFDSVRTVDTRILTLEIPVQQAITQDNVPVSIDGVIFLRVSSPQDAIIQVQNFAHAIRQYAQTALRDVIGALTLDQILADRESVGHQIEKMVEIETEGWGLEVAAIRIQDIVLPEDLKRVMARQASAEREKRANITKSEGDREAAENLAAAASVMQESPGALQLRTLQTLDSLGSSQANTVVLALPIEVTQALGAVPNIVKAFQGSKAPEPAKLDREALAKPAPPAIEQGEQQTTKG
jgi:regulator of protease activity HflC (stomatin/prohibitin superfamily)